MLEAEGSPKGPKVEYQSSEEGVMDCRENTYEGGFPFYVSSVCHFSYHLSHQLHNSTYSLMRFSLGLLTCIADEKRTKVCMKKSECSVAHWVLGAHQDSVTAGLKVKKSSLVEYSNVTILMAPCMYV